MTTETIPILVITGPPGVGKTSVMFAISHRLAEADLSHSPLDMDAIRMCHPSAPDDPFWMALGLRNLAAIWQNYHAIGAKRLILADIVETYADIATYAEAVPGAAVQVVRLQASLETITNRLAGRETGSSLRWHQQRAQELMEIMDREGVGDLIIDTENRSAEDIAAEILLQSGWLPSEEAS
jgi:broad-specificity NMP kinase